MRTSLICKLFHRDIEILHITTKSFGVSEEHPDICLRCEPENFIIARNAIFGENND